MKPLAYGYCRASTDMQSLTYDAQRKRIEEHFDRYLKDKFDFGGIFEDRAESAATPLMERPEGRRLWASLRSGDALIVAKMDRAFRSVIDGATTLEAMRQMKVHFHCLDLNIDTRTPMGQFALQLWICLGELERKQVSIRTREAIASARETGKAVGFSPPAGWMHVGDRPHRILEADMRERSLLHDYFKKYIRGYGSQRIKKHLANTRRTNGNKYHVHWLLYAVHAWVLGFPRWYHWNEHTVAIRIICPGTRHAKIMERLREYQRLGADEVLRLVRKQREEEERYL